MWYIGNEDYEYGLKYGDEVLIKPLGNNQDEYDLFGVDLYNLRTENHKEILFNIEDIINNFTNCCFDVFEKEMPKKPIFKDNKFYCPDCEKEVEEKVYYSFSKCENCSQSIDWEEE